MSEAYEQGWRAREQGEDMSDCPYSSSSAERTFWERGWSECDREKE